MFFAKRTMSFLFFIVTCDLLAQDVTIQGKMLDDSTNLPIDYVQIYVNDRASNYRLKRTLKRAAGATYFSRMASCIR
jgi:hypothetical protein